MRLRPELLDLLPGVIIRVRPLLRGDRIGGLRIGREIDRAEALQEADDHVRGLVVGELVARGG